MLLMWSSRPSRSMFWQIAYRQASGLTFHSAIALHQMLHQLELAVVLVDQLVVDMEVDSVVASQATTVPRLATNAADQTISPVTARLKP